MTAPYLPPVTVTAKRPSAIERALALLVAQQDATPQPNTPSGGQRLAAAIGGGTGFLDALERMKQPPIGPLEDSPRSRNAMLDAAVMGLVSGGGLTTKPTEEVWYHGSPADVYGPNGTGKFRLSAGETGVPALWGTSNWTTAADYARGDIALTPDELGRYRVTKSYYGDPKPEGAMYGLLSAAKNPIEHDMSGKPWYTSGMRQKMQDALARGHDAVIFRNVVDNYGSGGLPSDVIAWLKESAISPWKP